jgi:hypothetical protein
MTRPISTSAWPSLLKCEPSSASWWKAPTNRFRQYRLRTTFQKGQEDKSELTEVDAQLQSLLHAILDGITFVSI